MDKSCYNPGVVWCKPDRNSRAAILAVCPWGPHTKAKNNRVDATIGMNVKSPGKIGRGLAFGNHG